MEAVPDERLSTLLQSKIDESLESDAKASSIHAEPNALKSNDERRVFFGVVY
jgi:hypothetical protein